jgi:uncharacterized RmlC-like cupin family protein
MSTYRRVTSTIGEQLNAEILAGFLQNYQRDDVRKTHEFDGRYENIYLDDAHIPAMKHLIEEATAHAEAILAENTVDKSGLRAGYWFNFMPPGSVTLLHRHDDYDELLSAVYYVSVPDDSGKLIIHDDSNLIEVQPRAGDFVFFSPEIPHEVTRNNSTQSRLSIGINFGRPEK